MFRLFDQFAFVVNEQQNRYILFANNQINKQQFVLYVNFYEIIILFFHFANSTKSTFKRFFNDVINIVNNDVASKKRRKRFLKSKNDQRVFLVNVFAFYQFVFFEFVVVRFRQKIQRFARFANRVFFFNFFFKKRTTITISTNFFSYDYTQILLITNRIKNLNTFRITILMKRKNHVCSKKKKHTRKKSSNNAFEFEKLISKLDVTTKI